MDKYKRIKQIAHRDTAFGHFVMFTIRMLRHYLSQVILSFLGTVIIAVLIALQRYDFLFWITIILYCFLLYGISACKEYDKSLQEDTKNELSRTIKKNKDLLDIVQEERNLVNSLEVLQTSAGKNIYRVARQVKHQGWKIEIPQIREVFGFQRMCMETCKELYNLCKSKNLDADYYITVYQRIEGTEKSHDNCRMIAFANKDGSEPLSYHRQYPLKNDEGNTKEPLHSRIFLEKEVKNWVLFGKKEIDDNFVWHPENQSREKEIKAYIGIPVSVCNRKISFLLQLDSDNEKGFGNDKNESQNFANQIARPYALYLSMIYEFDRMNEVTDAYITKVKRREQSAKRTENSKQSLSQSR